MKAFHFVFAAYINVCFMKMYLALFLIFKMNLIKKVGFYFSSLVFGIVSDKTGYRKIIVTIACKSREIRVVF